MTTIKTIIRNIPVIALAVAAITVSSAEAKSHSEVVAEVKQNIAMAKEYNFPASDVSHIETAKNVEFPANREAMQYMSLSAQRNLCANYHNAQAAEARTGNVNADLNKNYAYRGLRLGNCNRGTLHHNTEVAIAQ